MSNTPDLIRDFKFKPTPHQTLAKAGFHRRLSEMSFMYSLETMSLDKIAKMASCSLAQIEDWGRQPGWAAWFFEADTAERLIHAHKELAIRSIINVLQMPIGDGKDGSVQPKDLLKAAELLARLGDMEPNKRKEVTFLDKDLGKLSNDEVDSEISKARAKLGVVKKSLTAEEA